MQNMPVCGAMFLKMKGNKQLAGGTQYANFKKLTLGMTQKKL